MKRSGRWGEGWLIAAALALLLALALALRVNRLPRAESAAPVHCVDAAALARAATIDVNAASAGALQELPGIGPALAEAIVQYREEHGPFESVEALDEVPGIGPVKLEAIRPYARVE